MNSLLQQMRRAWTFDKAHSDQNPSGENGPAYPIAVPPHRSNGPEIVDEGVVADQLVGERSPDPADWLRTYTTLMELRRSLASLERFASLTVVLVLDGSFSGHLSSLIERRSRTPVSRLVLAVESGRLPGLETIGDLTMARSALGWQEIVFERDAIVAINDAWHTLRNGERFLVFAPNWRSTTELQRGFNRSTPLLEATDQELAD
jgi:hypothetical protein